MTDLVYKQAPPELSDFGGAASVRGDIIVDEPAETAYIVCNGQVVPIGGPSGIAIGDPVIGGDQGRVLFINPAGILAQDSRFRFSHGGAATLFIGPVTGPDAYSALRPGELYLEDSVAGHFANLSGTTGAITLTSLAGVGERPVAAAADGTLVIGSGGVLPIFTPTIIPFADGAGELTESATLFWDGTAVNAPGIKLNAAADNTLLRQSSNNLQIFAGVTQIANFTPNNGAGGVDFRVYPQAYAAIGANGSAPANDNIVYALNSSTTASSRAGLWAAHNSAATGVAYLDLFRYAASVVNDGWRVACQQSTGDDLRFFITGSGGSSDLMARLSRDSGFFLKNVASRPAVSGSFGYLWSDTEGSPALSGPNGDTFRWYHTAKNLAVGRDAFESNSSGTSNIAIGFEALKLSTDSFGDVAIGSGAMAVGTSSGGTNVAIGAFALDNFTVDAAGNVAIGESPMSSGGAVSGVQNIGIGREACGALTSGERNIGLGELTLTAITTGDDNVAVGAGALASVTTANNNTALGAQAFADSTSATGRVGVGFAAGANVLTGDYDIAIGYRAMVGDGSDATAGFNVVIGMEAMLLPNGGGNNVVIGHQPMAASAGVSGDYNVAIGELALSILTSGNDNVAIGQNTLIEITSGSGNIAIGKNALTNAETTSSNNIAIGENALQTQNTAVNGCVAIGHNALAASTANKNTAVGTNALSTVFGEKNTAIGYDTAGVVGSNNQTCVGHAATCIASDQVTFGDANVTVLRAAVTTITAISDRRDKKDIEEIHLGMDFIDMLRPVRFEHNARDGSRLGEKDIGFIAQELQVVDDEFTRLVYAVNPDRLEATPGRLTPIIVKSLQEINARLKAAGI